MSKVRRAIAALMLGVIVSVLLAWGADIRRQLDNRPSRGTQLRVTPNLSPSAHWQWFVTPDRSLGHSLYTFRLGNIDSNLAMAYTDSLDDQPVGALPHWVRVPSRGMHLESHGIGLPFPCLARQNINASLPRDLVTINLFDRRMHLATRPIWTGLIINAMLIGALLYPVTLIPATIRRRRRLKEGLCAACGYDLQGTSHARCPECGAQV